MTETVADAVARLIRENSPFRMTGFGRSDQDRLQQVSALLARAADLSPRMNEKQERVRTALSALTPEPPSGLLARLLRPAPPPMSAWEVRERVDAAVAALIDAEQALRKEEKFVAIAAKGLEEADAALAERRAVLERVAAPESGASPDLRVAAAQRLAELALSARVSDQMRLSVAVIRAGVCGMLAQNQAVQEKFVPVWDKVADSMDNAERQADWAVAQLRAAALEARAALDAPPPQKPDVSPLQEPDVSPVETGMGF